MLFTYIVGATSFLIASIAAFFSIKGISLLFSGSFWAVVLMASSLEIGKLVAASALYRYFEEFNKLIKLYLLTAVVVLMVVTSLGIFGFLTDAYNKSKAKYDAVQQQIAYVEESKNSATSKLNFNNDRIKTLVQIRTLQEEKSKNLSTQSVTTSKQSGGLFSSGTVTTIDQTALKNKQQMFELINQEIVSSNSEIQNLSDENNKLLSSIEDSNNQILTLKNKSSAETDIGTFKFVASSFNMELDTAVKWFILSLVFVFDPLAVILLLVYNHLLKKKIIV
jgi:hypothetical protein